MSPILFFLASKSFFKFVRWKWCDHESNKDFSGWKFMKFVFSTTRLSLRFKGLFGSIWRYSLFFSLVRRIRASCFDFEFGESYKKYIFRSFQDWNKLFNKVTHRFGPAQNRVVRLLSSRLQVSSLLCWSLSDFIWSLSFENGESYMEYIFQGWISRNIHVFNDKTIRMWQNYQIPICWTIK